VQLVSGLKNKMSYRLGFEANESFLIATAIGDRSLQTVIDMYKDLLAVCADKKIKKVLVDVQSMEGHLRFMESFEFITHYFPNIRNRNIINKCAVVDRKENEDENRLFETIAVNRGYTLNVFSDFNKAVDWLS
jgi:hypothetical protein